MLRATKHLEDHEAQHILIRKKWSPRVQMVLRTRWILSTYRVRISQQSRSICSNTLYSYSSPQFIKHLMLTFVLTTTSKARLLNLGAPDTWCQIIICCRGCPVQCRIFTSTPGLSSQGASSQPPPLALPAPLPTKCNNQKYVRTLLNVPGGQK